MAKETFDFLVKQSAETAIKYLAALIGSGKNKDASDFLLGVEGVPANEDVVVLPSANDVDDGRLSADIENKYGRSIRLLVSLTVQAGASSLDSIYIDAKIGSTYKQIAAFESLGLSAVGTLMLLTIPFDTNDPASFNGGLVGSVVPALLSRVYRIRTVSSSTTSLGSTLTYSISAVHLL